MEVIASGKVERAGDCHAPEVSSQTGFPSAATHYMEAPIDLNKELASNRDATFFVRVGSNAWARLGIRNNDVLIVDRSRTPHGKSLTLVVADGEFVVRSMACATGKEDDILWGVITYVIHRTI